MFIQAAPIENRTCHCNVSATGTPLTYTVDQNQYEKNNLASRALTLCREVGRYLIDFRRDQPATRELLVEEMAELQSEIHFVFCFTCPCFLPSKAAHDFYERF